ncbi:InlB B-repeat-containing protein [Ruminococcus flavefaciens]|uniref:InlB B-repeat-containing protein n=1 Tax=Ruminococcus flavefaciens TaxID=1265 RepID=UPI000467A169|nr:hypothetical protein [Ruminococcus flavefaciens]
MQSSYIFDNSYTSSGDYWHTLYVTFDNSTVNVYATIALFTSDTNKNYNPITVTNSVITTPTNGRVDGKNIVNSSGSVAKSFTITANQLPTPPEPEITVYEGLKVMGTQVTSANKDDITGNGVFKYNPSTKTLSTESYFWQNCYTAPIIENTGVDGLKIQNNSSQTVRIDNSSSMYPAVVISKNTTFYGSKQQYISAAVTAIQVLGNAKLTINSPIQVNNAAYGIFGSNDASLDFSYNGVKIDSSVSAVRGFKSITTYSTVIFSSPQPSTISSGIKEKSGSYAKLVTTAAKTTYDLYLNDTQVTSGNCNDILGDGKASFSYNKLTLKGDPSQDVKITNNISGLTIYVENDTYLSDDAQGDVMTLNANTTITGPGTLTVPRIDVKNNSTLTIQDGNVQINDQDIIYAYGSSNIKIVRSNVEVDSGIFSADGNITLDGCYITGPENGAIEKYSTYNSCIRGNAQISKEYDGIIIGGRKIGTLNRQGDNYSYDPETQTLTLKGKVGSTSDRSIESYVGGLTINVTADTDLTDVYGYNQTTLTLGGYTTIKGDGKLTVSRLNCNGDLTLDNANIKVDHPSFSNLDAEHLKVSGDLTIINSDVYTSGPLYVTEGFAINQLENCHIAAPSGAKLDEYYGGWGIKNGNSLANGVQIKKGYGFKIAGTEVTAESNLYKLGPNGAFEYVPSINTLILNKDIDLRSEPISLSLIENVSNTGLTINGNGHTMGIATDNILNTDTIFTGKLNVNTNAVIAFSCKNKTNVIIKDADLTVNSNIRCFNASTSDTCSMKIDNSKIAMSVTNSNALTRVISGFKNGITIDGCLIRIPENTNLLEGATQIDTKKLIISPVEYYPLYVCGEQVNEINRHDLCGGNAEYDANNNTLHILNNIDGGSNWCIDNQGIEGLNIWADVDYILTSDKGVIRIADGLETTIFGDDYDITFNVPASGTAISCGKNSLLSIENADITSNSAGKGIFCESNNASLEVRDSVINIKNATSGALYGFNNGVTMRGCELKTVGCVIENGSAVSSVNNTVKSAIVEIGAKEKIDIAEAEMYLDSFNYRYDGAMHRPTATIYYNGNILTEGKDYVYNCSSQNKAGAYTANASGIGDYKGTIYADWNISEMFSVKSKINGKSTKKMYAANTNVTVTAPEVEGKVFSHWTANGTNVSTANPYTFAVTENVTIESVYKDAITYELTEDLEDVEASVGDAVVMRVEAAGTTNYRWQWSSDGISWNSIGNNNKNTFSFTMAERFAGRKYRCILNNGTDTIESRVATLSLKSGYELSQDLEDVNAAVGDSVVMTVAAEGTTSYQWQWSSDGISWNSIGNNNKNTFSFKMAERFAGRKYRCILNNGTDTIESKVATLSLKSGYELSQDLEDVNAAVGDSVVMTVAAEGTTSYQWQWSSDGISWNSIGNNNKNTFSFKMAERFAGRKYRCILSNGTDTIESKVATLSLKSGYELSQDLEDVNAAVGDSVVMTVAAEGTTSYQWQWSTNGTSWTDIPNNNKNTFSFTMAERFAGRKYRCILSNGTNTVETRIATLSLVN